MVFGAMSKANIVVDMIIQSTGIDGLADLSFTVPRTDFEKAKKLIESLSDKLKYTDLRVVEEVAKVSIVGVGMRSHAGVAGKAFAILAENNINIDMISTSEIKISVVVSKEQGKQAVKLLHEGFELHKPAAERKVKL